MEENIVISNEENEPQTTTMEEEIVISNKENKPQTITMEEEILSEEEMQPMTKLEQKRMILSIGTHNSSEETLTSTITATSTPHREAARFSETLEQHFFDKLIIHKPDGEEERTLQTSPSAEEQEEVKEPETEEKTSERVSGDMRLSDDALSDDIQLVKQTPRTSKVSSKRVSISEELQTLTIEAEIEEKRSSATSLPLDQFETSSEAVERESVVKEETSSIAKKECFPEQMSFQILNVKKPLPESGKKTAIIDMLPEKMDVSWLDEMYEDEERPFDYDEGHKASTVPEYKEMRFEYGRCPKPCERFMKVEDYSKIFIDGITDEASSRERNLRQQTAIKIVEGIEYAEDKDSEDLSLISIGTYVCVLEWPTIEQFTVEVGATKIGEFLSYWKLKEDWKYCINFLYGESDAACDFYRYEAIFSIPCKQYPIAQATASVYFTFEVSRIRPRSCLVDVYYCFEGQRSLHSPGIFTFQEERLFHIVDAKLKFFKTLTF